MLYRSRLSELSTALFAFPAMTGLLLGGFGPRPAVAADEFKPVGDPRMGTCTHFAQNWDVDTIMPLVAKSGVGWIRDEVIWPFFEEKKGVYNIEPRTLRWVNAAHKAGLRIVVCLNADNRIYDDHFSPEAYAKAAAYVARELKGKIQAIEVLNEPANLGYMAFYGGVWNGQEADGSVSPWVGKYVTLINTAAAAIKKADPTLKVIGLGSVTPVNFKQLALGISGSVDGIVDHPYSYQMIAEQIPFANNEALMKRDGVIVADKNSSYASMIKLYRAQSEKYHGPKELWFTEFGWSTFSESSAHLYAGFTESAQAKYILRRFMESLALGVNVNIQYDFKEDGIDPYNPEHHFGMIRADLSPKPAYAVVQNLSAAMSGFTPNQKFEVNVFLKTTHHDPHPVLWETTTISAPGTIKTYQFANAAGKQMTVLWNAERADGDLNPVLADVELKTGTVPTKVTAYDFFTNTTSTIPFELHGKRVMLKNYPVLDHPVALELG